MTVTSLSAQGTPLRMQLALLFHGIWKQSSPISTETKYFSRVTSLVSVVVIFTEVSIFWESILSHLSMSGTYLGVPQWPSRCTLIFLLLLQHELQQKPIWLKKREDKICSYHQLCQRHKPRITCQTHLKAFEPGAKMAEWEVWQNACTHVLARSGLKALAAIRSAPGLQEP